MTQLLIGKTSASYQRHENKYEGECKNKQSKWMVTILHDIPPSFGNEHEPGRRSVKGNMLRMLVGSLSSPFSEKPDTFLTYYLRQKCPV
jgi:hypothetical protein